MHFLFPVAGALLALTSALAAACFVKAFGISFLALPRSQAAADAHEVAGRDAGCRRRFWPRSVSRWECFPVSCSPR